MKKASKMLCMLLALAMLFSLAACGGDSGSGGSSDNPGSSAPASDPSQAVDTGDKDNGDGSFTNEALGYTYGSTFKSDTPITYTMFFNDNDAYPIKDSWRSGDGVFAQIEAKTGVKLDIEIVNNASYTDRLNLAIASGDAPTSSPRSTLRGPTSPAAASSPSATTCSICPTTCTCSTPMTSRPRWTPCARRTASTTAWPA